MKNQEVAKLLFDIAEILEFQNVQFKPQAYRRAAQGIESYPNDIEELYKENSLRTIPGVGESIEAKIKEYLETGKLSYLDELRKDIPPGLIDLLQIEGIGPKKAMELYKTLKITSIEDLAKAAEKGEIRKLKGFSEKSERNIIEAIKFFKNSQERVLLGYILPFAEALERKLSKVDGVQTVNIAGSIRRRKETIGDIDIVIASTEAERIINFFTQLPDISEIIMKGTTRSSVLLSEGIQADLRVVDFESYGSTLLYFTGSKEHNIKLREIAIKKDLKLNEYGVFNRKTDKKLTGRSEDDIYELLGLNYIEPELRENRGEIEVALKQELPKLITLGDVKGDLHVHTNWSDGVNSIEEMANMAQSLGHEYIAICDHAVGMPIAHGLSEERLLAQIKEIERINRKLEDFTIFSGIEADINSKGNLDVSNSVLKQLDVVVASVHSGFKQDEAQMTNRILNAIHNEHVNIIGHPTGRLLNKREPYHVNLLKVAEAASNQHVYLEINAYPDRLDLSDINCFKLRDRNVGFSLGSDAHSRDHLEYLELGVFTARRGWLEKKNVINTLNRKDITKIFVT
jgi:DNA polymerase (family 10)